MSYMEEDLIIRGTNEECTYIEINGFRLVSFKYILNNDGVEKQGFARVIWR